MLGEASDFTPLDLLGSLGLNVLATHTMVKRGQGLRVGFKVKNSVRSYTDYRFLGGTVAAVAAQFGGPTVRRVANGVASGLLHSYVTTETINMIAQKDATLLQELQSEWASPTQKQVTQQAPPQQQEQQQRDAQPVGAPNQRYGYGW